MLFCNECDFEYSEGTKFCPQCGATLYYQGGPIPDAIAIPVGLFADPGFPAPGFSVWEKRKRDWVAILGDDVEHRD